MSSGANCRFNQTGPQEWNYELQQWPYGETPKYNTYGPFTSYKLAEEHLSDHHQNPGGWSINRLEGHDCPHLDLTTYSDFRQPDEELLECRDCGRTIDE